MVKAKDSITLVRVNDGVNGTPGAKGADGRTTYFHVKYSNDGGKTFTANSGETVGTYIGTCTDYNSADPTAVGSYTWARIKGDTGATGDTGASFKTFTTNYAYGQNNIDKYSASGYSGTWAVNESTSGLRVGDTVQLRCTNSSKSGYCFIIAKVTAIPGDKTISCVSSGLIDKGDTGATGAKGDTGKGATSIIEQYYLSTSSTTQAGGSWSTTQPTWSSGKYIWTRSHITWTDGTTTDTTPVLAGGLNSANQNAFNANNTANNANNTANSAQSTANSAQSTANSAQSTANSKNAIFYATSAPSGSHKVNDVWFDTAHGNKMYYWTGSTWSSGLFDTAAIKDGAVTGKLIAGQTITGDKIASRTIVATNIAAATITANEILGGTITSNEIAAGTITADKIASRTLTADRIKAGALTATEIAAGTITADKVNMSSLQSNIGYIGNKSGRHVEITSDAVKVMADASTVLGYFGSTINIRNAFTVDASGNGSFTGKITSSSGQIGGWTITNTDLFRNYTNNNGFSCSTNLMGGKIVFSGTKTETINGQNTRRNYSINMDEIGLYFVGSNTAVYNGQDGETESVYGKFNYDTRYDTSFTFQTWYQEPGGDTHLSFMNADRISTTGNVQANTFNRIKLKDLIKTKYLTASNKKFVKNGSSNNTISVPDMSGYKLMGVYVATIDSDKVYPYNSYYDPGNKVFHVLGHNISGADVTTVIHGVAFYIANV